MTPYGPGVDPNGMSLTSNVIAESTNATANVLGLGQIILAVVIISAVIAVLFIARNSYRNMWQHKRDILNWRVRRLFLPNHTPVRSIVLWVAVLFGAAWGLVTKNKYSEQKLVPHPVEVH